MSQPVTRPVQSDSVMIGPTAARISLLAALLLGITAQLTHQTPDASAVLPRAKPQKPTSGADPNGRCNAETEFHCELERRCIPREWRCDFLEQCLDGQDELSCPPERCNFEHDHCYWLDEPANSSEGHNFWRRYSVGLASERVAANMVLGHQSKPKDRAAGQSVATLLSELSSELPERSKFIFVPISWKQHQVRRRAADTSNLSSDHLRVRRARITTPAIGRSSGMCQLRFEYAILATSTASRLHWRANTTLRLVAEHAAGNGTTELEQGRRVVWLRKLNWSPSADLGQNESAGGQGGEQDKAIGYHRESRDRAGTPTILGTDWTVGVAELGHLERFKLSFEVVSSVGARPQTSARTATNNRKSTPSGPDHAANEAGEGPAPADHRTGAPTSNVAGNLCAGPAGDCGRRPISKNAQRPATSAFEGPSERAPPAAPADHSFEGVLVGLRWLEFHACRDWPRGAANDPRRLPLGPFEGGGSTTNSGNKRKLEPELESVVRARKLALTRDTTQRERATNSTEPATHLEDDQNDDETDDYDDDEETLSAREKAAECLPTEFRCSSGACLCLSRLCNFVDDCYTSNGRRALAWPWLAVAGSKSDDESNNLCQPILGRESFEPDDGPRRQEMHPAESQQMELFSTSRPDKFWHLTGNWPIGRVSIRRSMNPKSEPQAHLPFQDHTTRSEAGSYLSLELPSPPGGGASGPRVLWASIQSQWMQRLNEREFGECRLKFFYNFISPQLAALATGRHTNSNNHLPLKLSIGLEHLSLGNQKQWLDSGSERRPLERQRTKVVRTVETVLHSELEVDIERLTSRNRSHAPIELAGVDFWREVNVPIGALNEGDFFQLRLVILAQLQQEPADLSNQSRQHQMDPLGSVNIDDLATHFGCGPVEDAHQLERLNKLALLFWREAVPKPSDYLRPVAQSTLWPLKNKWNRFGPISGQHQGQSAASHHDQSSWFEYDESPWPSVTGLDSAPLRSWPLSHQHHFEQVEPQTLVAYVLCALCLIIGLIALIVFVMVPYVERAMMQHHNQIQLSLSGEISDVPASHSATGDFFSVPPDAIAARRTATLFGPADSIPHHETRFTGVSPTYKSVTFAQAQASNLPRRRSLSGPSASSSDFNDYDNFSSDAREAEQAASRDRVHRWRISARFQDGHDAL